MLAFVHVPKNAGGSIKHWIKTNNLKILHAGHKDLKGLVDHFPNCNILTSFAITRNTYSRCISLYNFVKIKSERRIKENKNSALGYKMLDIHKRGIEYTLEWFVDNNHVNVKYQQDFIKGVSLVIPFESLKVNFQKIQKLTNCYSPLTNTIHKSHNDTSHLFTQSYINCVERLFAPEIDYFNYSPNDK